MRCKQLPILNADLKTIKDALFSLWLMYTWKIKIALVELNSWVLFSTAIYYGITTIGIWLKKLNVNLQNSVLVPGKVMFWI